MRVPSASCLPSPPGEAGVTSMEGGVYASVPSTQAAILQGSSKGGSGRRVCRTELPVHGPSSQARPWGLKRPFIWSGVRQELSGTSV